jgi:hypothetical protein
VPANGSASWPSRWAACANGSKPDAADPSRPDAGRVPL